MYFYFLLVSCTDEEITCHNSKCISRSLICNGIDECGDGTDEEKCGKKSDITFFQKHEIGNFN